VLMGSPGMRRGLGRLEEPLSVRLQRLLPEADLRIVADSLARRSAGNHG